VKFRKKPVVIEAIQWTGTNASEMRDFITVPHRVEIEDEPEPHARRFLVIHTLEGDMAATPGDWIIKGVKGEFYPCKPDIFAATYEGSEESVPLSWLT
jgi:hypothetical protein